MSFAAKSLEDCSSLPQRTREEKVMTTQIKLVLAGNSATGKTAFVKRYVNDVFVSKYTPTLGKDLLEKKVERWEI